MCEFKFPSRIAKSERVYVFHCDIDCHVALLPSVVYVRATPPHQPHSFLAPVSHFHLCLSEQGTEFPVLICVSLMSEVIQCFTRMDVLSV